MESKWFRGGSSSDGFAFNDNHLSNRTDPLDAPPDSVWTRPCKKRRHENDNSMFGDEAAKRYRDSSAVRVKTLHISSHILPFFYKLSSYGMSESEQTHVRIKLSGNTLNITTAPELLDVLMAADKFELSSCMNYCRQLLRNSPMTLDSALLYLEFPHTDALQPLTHAAKQYLVGRYKIITKFKEEVMALPLSGIEALLASDDLRVVREDVVYYTVLKWVRQHYDGQKERQEVVGTRLARLIRFPYMTCQTLEKVLTCDDFAHKDAFELVLEAILFKADAQQSLTTYALNPRFVERAYLDRYVKVVEFEPPRQQCVVYLDLKQKECVTWFPFGSMKTQPFYLGGQRFFLAAKCNTIDECKFHFFDMIVAMSEKSSGSFVVDLEYAARLRPGEEFVNMFKSHYTFTAGTSVGGDMFGVPWTKFIAEDSPFFINGILHLRAQLTIIP